MGDKPEIDFANLLAMSSDFVIATDDEEVKAILDSYGISFKGTRGAAYLALRADLLACVALLRTHHADLEPVLSNCRSLKITPG